MEKKESDKLEFGEVFASKIPTPPAHSCIIRCDLFTSLVEALRSLEPNIRNAGGSKEFHLRVKALLRRCEAEK